MKLAVYAARVAAARRVLESVLRVVQVERRRDAIGSCRDLLRERIGRRIERRRAGLGEHSRRLDGLSPLAVLARDDVNNVSGYEFFEPQESQDFDFTNPPPAAGAKSD